MKYLTACQFLFIFRPDLPDRLLQHVLSNFIEIGKKVSIVLIFVNLIKLIIWGFPGSSVSEESACSAGDLGLIPGWGRSPGEGNGNPLQYSCLENPMPEEPRRLHLWGRKSQTQPSNEAHHHIIISTPEHMVTSF